MRLTVIFTILLSLLGCSDPYSHLEKTYNSAVKQNGYIIPANEIYLFSLDHGNSGGRRPIIAKIRLNKASIEISAIRPSYNNLLIPASDINFCGMTCYGTKDPRVDLLLGKLGVNIMIKNKNKNKNEMLDWCWDNKIPMISTEDQSSWISKILPLPPRENFEAQFDTREKYDEQAYQSCLGY